MTSLPSGSQPADSPHNNGHYEDGPANIEVDYDPDVDDSNPPGNN